MRYSYVDLAQASVVGLMVKDTHWNIFYTYQPFIDGISTAQTADKPHTVYPKKYAHGFCFAVLCCGYTLTDFPISIRLTSLALWQSNDCPSASKVTLMNMDKHFMWIHYERLHNHNKAKHNETVCIFLGIYCNDHRQILLRWWKSVANNRTNRFPPPWPPSISVYLQYIPRNMHTVLLCFALLWLSNRS